MDLLSISIWEFRGRDYHLMRNSGIIEIVEKILEDGGGGECVAAGFFLCVGESGAGHFFVGGE